MARTEQVILTNMCMVQDGAGNVLVQDFADMRRVFEEDDLSELYYCRENGELKQKFW